MSDVACFNCDSTHELTDCPHPRPAFKCPDCLVVAMYQNHFCAAIPRFFHDDVRADVPCDILKIQLNNSEDVLFFLSAIGMFEETSRMVLMASAVNGLIKVDKNGNEGWQIAFSATTSKRFSIAFAFMHGNEWRLRSIVVASQNGIRSFALDLAFERDGEKYLLPIQKKWNIIAVFGVHVAAQESIIKLEVLGNDYNHGFKEQMKFIPEANSVEIGEIVEKTDDALKTAADENALVDANDEYKDTERLIVARITELVLAELKKSK